jgi:penicillin-binding protein 2
MANLAAIFANKGWYRTPHLVRAIGEAGQFAGTLPGKHHTEYLTTHWYDWWHEGMRRVVQEPGGTARQARIPGITMCGKTGTAENPHGKDHAVFIAFAPMEDPKIAIAVYVENSGFGGTWAAPIASLIIEQYLRIPSSDRTGEAHAGSRPDRGGEVVCETDQEPAGTMSVREKVELRHGPSC